MFKEVRLGVVVISKLHQISELFLGGKSLHQAGEDGRVLMLHTLVQNKEGALFRLRVLKF